MRPNAWPEPTAGILVWCRFPDLSHLKPGRKPGPALVLTVFDDLAPLFRVLVAYGTSQKTDKLYAGEFRIAPQDGEAYALSGLSFPTKFILGRTIELPYTVDWFTVPPAAPFGQLPKLGVLHPILIRRVSAAWKAATQSR